MPRRFDSCTSTSLLYCICHCGRVSPLSATVQSSLLSPESSLVFVGPVRSGVRLVSLVSVRSDRPSVARAIRVRGLGHQEVAPRPQVRVETAHAVAVSVSVAVLRLLCWLGVLVQWISVGRFEAIESGGNVSQSPDKRDESRGMKREREEMWKERKIGGENGMERCWK